MTGNRGSRRLSRAVAGAAVLVLALAGTACQGPAPVGECDWMHVPMEDNPGRLAILVDISTSTRSVDGSYTSVLADAVGAAVERRDRVAVASFGTGRQSGWTELSTDWLQGVRNEQLQEGRKAAARDCVLDAVRAAEAEPPTQAGTDILLAARDAAGWVAGTTGPQRIVLATDGLATTGCADLTRSRFDDAEIPAIVAECGRRGELPPALAKTELRVIGLGHTGPSQPRPSGAQADWLVGLWEQLCRKADAVACTAEDGGTLSGTRALTVPAGGVDDPPISFGGTSRVFPVPAASLFDTGSSAVRETGLPELRQIAVQARTAGVAHVEVVGYADPRGADRPNQELSAARAEAVAVVLRDNGAQNVTARGSGETVGCPEAAATTGERLQCSRRVDVVITQN